MAGAVTRASRSSELNFRAFRLSEKDEPAPQPVRAEQVAHQPVPVLLASEQQEPTAQPAADVDDDHFRPPAGGRVRPGPAGGEDEQAFRRRAP